MQFKNQTNTEPIYISCAQCARAFRVSPSRLATTKFCGRDCYSEAVRGIPFYGVTHGFANKVKAYSVWKGMRRRCNSPSEPAYKNYGGRGITVCERWNSFPNFYSDMGDPPEGLSLDRIDNDKGYSPDNCRWATAQQQALNRRPRTTHGVA